MTADEIRKQAARLGVQMPNMADDATSNTVLNLWLGEIAAQLSTLNAHLHAISENFGAVLDGDTSLKVSQK